MDDIRAFVATEHHHKLLSKRRAITTQSLRRNVRKVRETLAEAVLVTYPDVASAVITVDDTIAIRIRTVQSQRSLQAKDLVTASHSLHDDAVKARQASVPGETKQRAWWQCIVAAAHANTVHQSTVFSLCSANQTCPRVPRLANTAGIERAARDLHRAIAQLDEWKAGTAQLLHQYNMSAEARDGVKAALASLENATANVCITLDSGVQHHYKLCERNYTRVPSATPARLRKAPSIEAIGTHIANAYDTFETAADLHTAFKSILDAFRAHESKNTSSLVLLQSK